MSTKNGKLQLFAENKKEFLGFLKSRYKLYHQSNVFFRDLHYGVMAYLAWRNMSVGYSEGEELTKKIVETWENDGVLKKIDRLAYLLQYPDFKKPSVKPVASAKPAAKPASPSAKPPSPAEKPAAQESTDKGADAAPEKKPDEQKQQHPKENSGKQPRESSAGT